MAKYVTENAVAIAINFYQSNTAKFIEWNNTKQYNTRNQHDFL